MWNLYWRYLFCLQLEQGVNVVEQFYMTADNKQHNTDKYNSVVKDKIREKYLTKIENQEQHASQREAAAEKRMRELMRQFAGIFHQANINTFLCLFEILLCGR